MILFPTECTGDNSDIKFINKFSIRAVAVNYALLLIVYGIRYIHLSIDGIYSQAVVNRTAVFEKRAYRYTTIRHIHAPDVFIDPVKFVPFTVKLYLRGPITQFELELLLHRERLGVNFIKGGGFVTVGTALVASVCDQSTSYYTCP